MMQQNYFTDVPIVSHHVRSSSRDYCVVARQDIKSDIREVIANVKPNIGKVVAKLLFLELIEFNYITLAT